MAMTKCLFNFNALTCIQYNDNLALTVQQTVQQTPGNGGQRSIKTINVL